MVAACDGAGGAPPDGGEPPPPDGMLPDGAPIADVEPGEVEAAGAATTYVFDASAYLQPLAGLAGPARTRYIGGQSMFEIDWIVAPSAGNPDKDGLGPTFNSTSCRACHLRNGRGAPPTEDGGALTSALLRVSDAAGAPHPVYGDQIQPNAIPGVPAEGEVRLRYTPVPGAYADGAPYELLRAEAQVLWALGDPGPLAVSVRVAQATIGQGFLEAIPEAAILAGADPEDIDGDGISGRARRDAEGSPIGRFGWKGGQPTVDAQNAAALLGDLGLTTSLHPAQNCPAAQPSCGAAPSGGAPELDDLRRDALRAFVIGTSVPARRGADALDVRRGKWLFREVGCAACHVPRWQTGAHDFPGIAAQAIWPYTDLLLHDMGDGLADGRPEGDASGREWRTPPLWGLGLVPVVNGHLRLLHDGRARGVAEAILWHGGEGEAAASKFRALAAPDRAALEAFLMSL